MSKNHPNDNIYSILDKLDALKPTPQEQHAATVKSIYEAVESQGSILKGLREVSSVEARLARQFAESKVDEAGQRRGMHGEPEFVGIPGPAKGTPPSPKAITKGADREYYQAPGLGSTTRTRWRKKTSDEQVSEIAADMPPQVPGVAPQAQVAQAPAQAGAPQAPVARPGQATLRDLLQQADAIVSDGKNNYSGKQAWQISQLQSDIKRTMASGTPQEQEAAKARLSNLQTVFNQLYHQKTGKWPVDFEKYVKKNKIHHHIKFSLRKY